MTTVFSFNRSVSPALVRPGGFNIHPRRVYIQRGDRIPERVGVFGTGGMRTALLRAAGAASFLTPDILATLGCTTRGSPPFVLPRGGRGLGRHDSGNIPVWTPVPLFTGIGGR